MRAPPLQNPLQDFLPTPLITHIKKLYSKRTIATVRGQKKLFVVHQSGPKAHLDALRIARLLLIQRKVRFI